MLRNSGIVTICAWHLLGLGPGGPIGRWLRHSQCFLLPGFPLPSSHGPVKTKEAEDWRKKGGSGLQKQNSGRGQEPGLEEENFPDKNDPEGP